MNEGWGQCHPTEARAKPQEGRQAMGEAWGTAGSRLQDQT